MSTAVGQYMYSGLLARSKGVGEEAAEEEGEGEAVVGEDSGVCFLS